MLHLERARVRYSQTILLKFTQNSLEVKSYFSMFNFRRRGLKQGRIIVSVRISQQDRYAPAT